MRCGMLLLCGLWLGFNSLIAHAAESTVGVPVAYSLPTTGPLPQTYQVTVAITDPKNPAWILSTFVAAQPRTVTAENGGKFVETWDGLDENFMPLPPGEYGVKAIYTPAKKWHVDGAFHSVVPQFAGGPNCWLPSPENWNLPEPFGGDPCGAPLGDIDVAADGIGVFYWVYLENGLNQPLFDLKKPVGYDQFLKAFNSGGAGGGTSTCTDGESIWSFSTDGGPKYVYRADGKPFGTGRANRQNVYRPDGWVKSMACFRDAAAKQTYVYVAQGGRITETPQQRHTQYAESDTDRIDTITVHAGDKGTVLGELKIKEPRGLVARSGVLYVLHKSDKDAWQVSAAKLANGLPQQLTPQFVVPAKIQPTDLEVDSHGRLYLSDRAANHVYQLDAAGKITHTFGKLDQQKPGTYDPHSFICPGKLATWTDATGQDRLLVVEDEGPNRASEWSAEGPFIREFLTPQTKANDGWTLDPENPSHAYIAGQKDWLTRFKIDYKTRLWTIDAVWPNVEGLRRPVFIRANGNSFLACKINALVFRLAGDQWVKSAGVITEGTGGKALRFTWHDANNDGEVQDNEKAALESPGHLFRYHGSNWLNDLSLIAPDQSGDSVWRLSPSGFDPHGNPIFRNWQKVLTDPVFEARKAGTATALFGGNELAATYSSDWAQVDGSLQDGFYVQARGGKSFSANEGAQIKLSRYVPDGKGGYSLKWRVGRTALQGLAKPSEMYGAIHLFQPMNGIVSVIDQSRCGVLLYTDEGLYIDTVFPDGRQFARDKYGVYPQPGEFFAGQVLSNRENGKIYIAMGKVSPQLFELVGWSLKENPVQKLTTVQPKVVLTADKIAAPPDIALAVRGGAGAAKLARVLPAIGGANLTGTLSGWESCDPLRLAADQERTVEARLLYDADHLYVRWHVRLGTAVAPKASEPADRLFSHDRLADTVSLYLQGDPNAAPGKGGNGRPGDARFIFSVCNDGKTVKPVVLGMYPKAPAGVKAQPVTYRTPVSTVQFGHVSLLSDAKLNWVADADNRGFVLTAALPRSVLPGQPVLKGGLRTMINCEATLAGHNKFWWSNADGTASRETYDEPTEANLYPGSWAPAQFMGLDDGILVRNWQICGPFGGPNFEKLTNDPNGPLPGSKQLWKDYTREICEPAKYPPDDGVDLKAKYTGDMLSGYWGKPGAVTWKRAVVEDLDTRIRCGQGGQIYYGATWIYVPTPTDLDFQFQSHPMTPLRWFLNGSPMETGKYVEVPKSQRSVATKKVLLPAGWNEIRFRGYCFGYPPFRVGLNLAGAEDQLWKVRLADTPPAASEQPNKSAN